MKKIIIGLFVFSFLIFGGLKSEAYTGNSPLSDLIVSDFSWEPKNPVAPSMYLSINVTVKNIGSAGITFPEGMRISLYEKKANVGTVVVGAGVYMLNPGESKDFSFFTIQEPSFLQKAGDYTLTMVADASSSIIGPNGLVEEINEENNSLSKKITVSSTLTSTSTSVAVTSPNGGDVFVKNTKQKISWKDNVMDTSVSAKYYDISLIQYQENCATVASKGSCSLRPQLAPISIAKKVAGFSYDWQIHENITAITAATNFSIPDGQYTIKICRTGTETCDSSDNYFTLTSDPNYKKVLQNNKKVGEVFYGGIINLGEVAPVDSQENETTEEINEKKVKVTTQEKVSMVNSKLVMETSSGESKNVEVMPEEMSEILKMDSVTKAELVQESEKPIYAVEGSREGRLFWVFPATMNVEAKVDAEVGEVISIEKPWWSFLFSQR